MNRETCRIEPLLSQACINKDYVNRKDKLRDLTPVENPPDPYTNAAGWILFGFLVLAILINAALEY
jgi:hypothetical protein